MHNISRATFLSPFGRAALAGLVFGTVLFAAGLAMAQPGQNQEAWSPAPRDRAGLAVVMGQANGDIDTSGGSGSGASATTLVCGGGGGTSSATANSTCIILNNATGSVGIGQDSVGDQGATTSTATGNSNTMSSALAGLMSGTN